MFIECLLGFSFIFVDGDVEVKERDINFCSYGKYILNGREIE